MAAAHELCAARLLALCLANGGVYVKLGQHVGQESSDIYVFICIYIYIHIYKYRCRYI